MDKNWTKFDTLTTTNFGIYNFTTKSKEQKITQQHVFFLKISILQQQKNENFGKILGVVWCNSFYFITVDWGLITRKFIIWEMDEMDKIWPFDSYNFFNLQF